MKPEYWKTIRGYEGLYKVSNHGRVKSLARISENGHCLSEKILSPFGTSGYLSVKLTKDSIEKTIKIHRIVASAFLRNPNKKPQINHINGNRGDNRTENLEWVTGSENMSHAYKTLRRGTNSEWMKLNNPMSGKKGSLCKNSKAVKQYDLSGKFLREFGSCEEAERTTGIKHISCVCRGERKTSGGFVWKYSLVSST